MPNAQPQPAATGQRPQPDQLAGLVERVTFHNDESGFCVLRIKARGHRYLVTVPVVGEGMVRPTRPVGVPYSPRRSFCFLIDLRTKEWE